MEGGLLTALGALLGFALGWCISLILVFIVNPQSFHWTMQMSLPWKELLLVAALLMASASVTARGVGPPCGFGKRNTRSTGGLVMHISQAIHWQELGCRNLGHGDWCRHSY